ncbi:MAG: amidase [Solirubrobacteraceae bacterium]
MVPVTEQGGGASLTERSALELARAIRAGELTALEVVEAHIERTSRWGPRINAVIADRFQMARQEARDADARLASATSAQELPALLGVPFTVKESIAVAGMPNAAGVVARGEHRAQRSAPAVARLISAGAIPIGVTNTSELTLWIESVNPLYGRTSNPYDLRRTAGGSSGGEGASIGSGGAPFGLASDIAGSIRIPALFCGVFGHKPSPGVVPNCGMWPPTSGVSGRMLGVGPLARRAEDLMPVLRIIAGPDPDDPLSREATLGDPLAVTLEGLTVTVVEDASRRPLSRELRDGRERALGALAAAGARVRRVGMSSWRGALMPYLATLQAGSGSASARSTARLLEESGEQRPTWGTLWRRSPRHSAPTRVALAAELIPDSRGKAARRRLVATAETVATELLEAIGDGVLLHPAHARVAPRHRQTLGRLWLLTPAAVFNLAGVPVTEAPLGLSETGLPVGIQVAAAPGQDHVSIAVALELERVFGGWSPPPEP